MMEYNDKFPMTNIKSMSNDQMIINFLTFAPYRG